MIQNGLYLYWAEEKTNYFVDELYSKGYAHYYNISLRQGTVKIGDREDWVHGKWLKNSEFKKLFIVGEEESLFRIPACRAAGMILERKNYMGLLNIAESIISPGKMSKRPGILMNMLFQLMTQFLFIFLMKRMKFTEPVILCAASMYGFCGMTIGLVEYIRFYILTILLFVISFYAHYRVWTDERLSVGIAALLCSNAVLYLAIENSQLIMVIGGAFSCLFFLGLLVRRRWRSVALYSLLVIMPVLFFLWNYTPYIQILMHLRFYKGVGGAVGRTAGRILTATAKSVRNNLALEKDWVVGLLFGHRIITALFIILIVVSAVILMKRKKLPESGKTAGFMLITGVTLIVFSAASSVAGLDTSRYYSLAFFPAVLLIFFALDRIYRTSGRSRIILAAVVLLTAASAVYTSYAGEIEYIYRDEKPVIEELRKVNKLDVILIEAGGNPQHEIYDCVNQMSAKSRICPVNIDNRRIRMPENWKQVLVWIRTGKDTAPYLGDLEKYRYELTPLGSTHISDIYLMTRQD